MGASEKSRLTGRGNHSIDDELRMHEEAIERGKYCQVVLERLELRPRIQNTIEPSIEKLETKMVESPSKKRKKSTALKGSYKKLKLNDEEQDASTSKVQAEPKPIPDIAEYVKITARAKRQSDCQYKSTESKKMGYVNKRRKKNSEHKNSDDGDNFILKGSAVEILKQLQKAGIWTMLKDIDAKLETQKSLSEGESNIGEEERRKLKENTNISTSSELSHETVKIPSTQLSYTNVSSPERCLQKKNKLRPVVVIEKLNQEEQKCLSSAEKDSSASSEKSGVKSRCIIKNQKEKFISSLQCPESAEKLVPEELPMTVSEYNAYASLTQMEMNRLSIPTLEQTAKKYYGSLLHNKADSFTPSQKRAKNVPSSKNSKCSKNMHGFGDKPMKENFQQDLVLPEKVEKYPPSKLNVDAELWRAKQDQLRKMVKMPVKKRDQPVKVKNVAESKTEQQLLKVNKNESVLLLKEKPQCISPKLNKNIDEAESHMKSPPTEMKAGKTCSSQSRRRLSDIASSTSIAEKEEKMRVKQRGQPREVANAPQNKTKQPLVQVNEIESALLVEGKPNCTSTPKHNRYVDEAESNFMLPPSEKKFESKTYSRASRRFSSDSSRSSNLSETSINEKEEKVPVEKRGQLKKVAKRSDKKAALQLVQVNKIESAQLVEGKPNCTSVSKYGEKDLDEAESNIILPPLEKKTCSRISRRLSSDDTSSSSSSILSETSIDEKEEKVPRKSGQPRKAAIASHKKSDLRLVQVNKIESAQLVEGKPNCISVSKYDEKDLDEAESNIILPPSEKKTCSRISLRLSNDDTSIRCSILSETSIEDMEEKMSVKKRDQLRKVANAPQNIAEQQLVHEKPSDTSVSEYEKNTNVVESNIISPPEEKVERKACVRRYQRLISDDASSRSSVMSENSINENEEVCVQTSRRKFQDKRLFSTSSSDMEHDTVSHDTFSSGSHAEEGKKIASKENTDVIICVDQQNLTHNDELSLQNISEKSLKIERKKENSSHKQNAGMHVRVNNLKRKGFKVLKRNNTKKCLRKLKPKGSLLVSKTDRATLHRKHQNETPKEVTVNIENMTLHGKAPEKVTVTDNNASSNCSSPNKVRLQSCPLAERVNLDIVRSGHSHSKENLNSGRSPSVENVRLGHFPLFETPWSGHSPSEEEVRSTYSPSVERVRTGQPISIENPRSEHSPLEKKVKSAYSSPVERVRPEQSVSNVNPRSEHSPLEKKVKSAYSSPVERVRPEQSVSNVNPRSEQSPLEKKVKSAYSSPVERVRPEQSVSVDMDQRSGCSPSVENPRYEHSPPVEYPRSGHSHLEEKVNSTYTSSVEKVRTGQSVSVENPRPWLLSPVDNLGLGNSPTFENPRSQCCSPFENGRSDCSSSSKSTRSGYSPSFENPRPWVFSPIDNVALGNSPAFENPRSVCSSFENERSDCSPSGKSTRSGYSPSVENPRWRRSVSVENTRSGCSLSVENRIRTPEAETSEKQAVNVISQFCNSIPSRGMGSSTEKTVAEVHDSTPNNVQRFKWSFSKKNVLNVKSQSPDSVLGLEVSLLQKAAVESSHVLPVCPQISGDCAGSNQNSQVSIMLKNSDFDNTSESDRDSPERIVLRDNTAIQDNVKQYEAVNSPPKDAEDVSLFKKPFPLRGQLAGTTKFSTSEGKSKQKRAWLNERLTATSDEDEDESDVLSIFTESDFGDEPELRAYKTGYDEDNDDFQRCMSPLSITDFPSVKDNYLHELSILNKETNFVAPVRMPRNVRHLNRGFENEWKGAVPNTLVIEYGHNSMLPAHVIQQSMFNLFKGYCFKFLGQGCTKSICRFRHSFPNIELEWESEMVVNVLNYARQKNFGNLVNYIVTELMFKTQRENKWMTCFKFLLELQFTVEEIAEFMKVSVECCDLKSMHHLLTSCANTLNRYPLFKYIFMYFWKEFYSHLILSVRVNPMVIEILLMHCIQHDVDDFYRKCYDMLENLPPMLKNKISKQLLVDFYDKLDGELSQGNANLTLNCSSPVSNAVDGNESVSFVPGSCSELSGPSPTHDAPSIPPDNVLLNSEAAAIRKWLSANDVTSVTVSEKPEVPSVLQKLLPNPDLTSRTVDGKREVPSAQKQLHSTSRTVSDKQTGSGLLPSPDLTSRTVDGKTGVPSAQKQLHSTSRTVSDKQKVPSGSALLPSPDLTSRTVDGKREVPSAQKQLHSTSRTVSDKQTGSALLPSPDFTSRTVDGKPEVPSVSKRLSHNDTIPNTRKLRRTQYSKPLKQMDSSDSVVAPDFQNNCSIQLSQWQTSSANTAQKIGEFSKHPHISVQPDVKEKFLRSIQDGNYKVMFSILEEWAKKALTSSMDHNIFIDLQNIFWNISTSFFNLVNYSDFKVNPLRKKIMANFGMNRILECMEDDKWNEAFDIYRWMIQNHVRIEEAQVPDKLKTPCTNILSCAEVCIRAGKLSESIRLLKSRNLSMMDNKCWRVRGSTEDLQVLQMLWSHIFQLLVKRDLQKALDQYLEIINIQEHVDRYLIECGVAILVQMLQMRKDEMSVTLYASIEETCYNCLDHSTVRMLLVTLVNQNKERMAKTLFYRAIMIGTYPHIKTEDNTKCARVLSYMTREEMILGVKHLLDEIYTEVKNSPDLRNKYQAKIIIEEKELEIDKHMFLYLHTTTLNTLLEAKKRVLSVLESLTPSIAVVQALDDCIILDDDCIQEYLLHIRKMRPTTMPHQKQLPAAAVVK